MTIKTTRWSPDTCECVATYSWDDAVPDEQRVHTPISLEPCADHTRLHPNNALRWQAMENENKGKNAIWRKALDRMPYLRFQLPNAAGGTDTFEKIGEFEWTFDENRELHYNFPNATPKQLSDLNADLDADTDGSKVTRRLVSSAQIEAIKSRLQSRR